MKCPQYKECFIIHLHKKRKPIECCYGNMTVSFRNSRGFSLVLNLLFPWITPQRLNSQDKSHDLELALLTFTNNSRQIQSSLLASILN